MTIYGVEESNGVCALVMDPTEVQYISVFAAAVVAGSKEPDTARRLITFLASELATSAITNSGMERPRRR